MGVGLGEEGLVVGDGVSMVYELRRGSHDSDMGIVPYALH